MNNDANLNLPWNRHLRSLPPQQTDHGKLPNVVLLLQAGMTKCGHLPGLCDPLLDSCAIRFLDDLHRRHEGLAVEAVFGQDVLLPLDTSRRSDGQDH